MDKKGLLDKYIAMRRIRLIEKEIADNYHNEIREMHTPIHLCDGEEAIAVGVCSNLQCEDMVFSNHRSHGHYLAKGGNLDALIAELHSKETGCCRGKGGSMHLCELSQGIMLTSAIVAGNVSIATGYALAQKYKNTKDISAVFFGDGASEEGSVYESICYAVKMKLPILFVCENNRIAISTPFDTREPLGTISEKFSSIISSEKVNGNDVEEVAEVSARLINLIREGKGPQFIECETFRLRAHSNVGDGTEGIYRTENDIERAKLNDPIENTHKKLLAEGITNEIELKKIDECIISEVNESFARARAARLPDTEELYLHIFSEEENVI